MIHVTKKRHIAKTLNWRILATTDTFKLLGIDILDLDLRINDAISLK